MDLCCVVALLGMGGACVEALLDMGGALGPPLPLHSYNGHARHH